MGELLTFMMRLHGSSTWDEIVPNTDKQVVVVSATISNPTVKTDTVNINTYDGVLDFSSVQGIHYGNRYIKVSLRKTNGSTYDFDALRRKYLGQIVDCRFDTTSGYYYYGRLTAIEDDYQQDFRTITLTIDANPFRQPVSGATTVEIPVHNTSDLMPSFPTSPNISTGTDATDGVVKYSYTKNSYGSHDISMSVSGSATKGYLYLTVNGLSANRKYLLSVNGISGNSYITIRNGSKTGDVIGESEIKKSTTFISPSTSVVLVFTTSSSNARFMLVSLSLAEYTSTHIDGGDRAVSPTYLPRGYNINIEVFDENGNRSSKVLKKNTTMNPYFIIPRGGADIIAKADGKSGTLEIEYTKELL